MGRGGTGAGGVATTGGAGGAAGKGLPQNPQNLLPDGNDLWHFGHMTWGMTTGAAGAGRGGGAGAGERGAAGCDPACKAFPQRAHVGYDAGFMLPQEPHRM